MVPNPLATNPAVSKPQSAIANPWTLRAFLIAALCVAAAQTAAAASTPADCATLRLHGRRADAQACYQTLTLSADPYLRAEGDWGLELYAGRQQRIPRRRRASRSQRALPCALGPAASTIGSTTPTPSPCSTRRCNAIPRAPTPISASPW